MTSSSDTSGAGQAQAAPSSAVGTPLLWALVLMSGASGLIYEIVWIRALGRHFGTTAPAITTVLAAFMGGLALGSLTLGRWADRVRRPLAAYRILEISIAISGLAVSLLLLHGGPLLHGLARLVAACGPLAGAVRFVLFGVLLLVPATLMGGTLPLLARALVRTRASGRAVGGLYAANTAGAVLGALAPDLLLVPRLGMTAAVAVACLGNLAVALGAGRLPAVEAPAEAPQVGESTWLPMRPLVLYAVSGFCAMALELLWSRVLEHWTASQSASFSVLLAVFLAAVAAGSWLTRRLADRSRDPLSWAALLLAGTAPAVLLPLALARPWRAWATLPLSPDVIRPGQAITLLGTLLHALYLELPACLLMGAAFPFLAAAVVRVGAAGRQTGRLTAANTLAGVLGSVVAGFLLLPQLGLRSSFLVLGGVSAVAGSAVALSLAGHVGRPRVLAGLSLLGPAVVLLLAITLPADHMQRAQFADFEQIQTVHEGSTTTVAVVPRRWYGEPAYMELRTPGVSMSDTRFGARRYMGMMGHLGVLFAREHEDVLLICYGVGNTARSLLAHQGVRRLAVVDISPEVLEASPAFARPPGGDPLQDPRVEMIVDDGRQHLVTTEQRYDVITSEPPPPTNAGVANLYSVEYYRVARRRMKPGGVLTQWLPVFQLSEAEIVGLVAAFTEAFPHTALFYGQAFQLVLVGSDAPLIADLPAWRARAAHPRVAADLDDIGVAGVEDLLGSLLQGDEGLRAVAARGHAVTDDLPSIQYPTEELRGRPVLPKGLVGGPTSRIEQLLRPADRARAGALEPALLRTRRAVAALADAYLGPPEWRELVLGTKIRLALGGGGQHNATLALLQVGDDRIGAARAAVAHASAPASQLARAKLTLARRAFYTEDYAGALRALETLDPGVAGTARHWLLVGGCARALGRHQEAAAAFTRAGQASERPEFQHQMKALAAHSGAPLSPTAGPFVLPQQTH